MNIGLKEAVIALSLLFLITLVAVAISSPGFGRVGGKCVALIPIEGTISLDSSGGVLSGSTSSSNELVEEIQQADRDPSVGSILLYINSPGGSAVASKELYDVIADAKKPKVAYLAEIAASGGYYAASASDYIIANPATITGSIGARADLLNYAELFQKLGLREEVIKSGQYKDIGSGSRNLTEAERTIFQSIILESFTLFKNDVEKGRGKRLDLNAFQGVLDARILTASQAKSVGLIDDIGNKKKAEEKAAELANVSLDDYGYPELCQQSQGFDFTNLFSSFGSEMAKGFVNGVQLQSNPSLKFQYSQ